MVHPRGARRNHFGQPEDVFGGLRSMAAAHGDAEVWFHGIVRGIPSALYGGVVFRVVQMEVWVRSG